MLNKQNRRKNKKNILEKNKGARLLQRMNLMHAHAKTEY